MPRVAMAIVDQDTQYLDLLQRYIRKSDYAGRIAVKAFSRLDLLEQYLEQGEGIDIIIINANLYSSQRPLKKKAEVILLSEQPLYEQEGCLVIYKYQALNQILAQVMATFLQDNEDSWKSLAGSHNTRIFSVYSGTGGCGKTTLALNLAASLADRGQRVFYLNMESLPAIDITGEEGGEGDFSRLLYYLKGNPAQLLVQLENLKRPAQTGRYHTFKPAGGMQDMLEMTAAETKQLLTEMVRMGSYDVIVADLEASIHERNLAALQQSDIILWVLLDDAQCLKKNRMFLDGLEQLWAADSELLSPRIRFVLNKRLDKIYNNPRAFEFELSGQLPYVPEWKTIVKWDQMVSVPFFRQETTRLYETLNR
ncbi:MAG: AAA family ATPase [Syntrophomonadaceae bacterium]|jgi:cellulose biosynthesis protein BcsQ